MRRMKPRLHPILHLLFLPQQSAVETFRHQMHANIFFKMIAVIRRRPGTGPYLDCLQSPLLRDVCPYSKSWIKASIVSRTPSTTKFASNHSKPRLLLTKATGTTLPWSRMTTLNVLYLATMLVVSIKCFLILLTVLHRARSVRDRFSEAYSLLVPRFCSLQCPPSSVGPMFLLPPRFLLNPSTTTIDLSMCSDSFPSITYHYISFESCRTWFPFKQMDILG